MAFRVHRAHLDIDKHSQGVVKSLYRTVYYYEVTFTTDDFKRAYIWDINKELENAGIAVGDTIRLFNQDGDYCSAEIIGKGKEGSIKMTGKIFDAVVVVTKTVPAGEGVTTGKEVSEIVYAKAGFAAPSEEVARGIVLAETIKEGVRVDDQLQPVEVKLRAWA